jgi:REP element-mobilizing transposase RayT
MFHGINHQNIFEEEADFKYMLEILKNLKVELKFEIQAYCFMSNHIHLLLKEEKMGDVSNILKRLLIKYVMKFNRKHQRSGALIGSRYKSKTVEIDEYFIPLIAYIHQNPMRSGIVKNPINYRYSSYQEYVYYGKPSINNSFKRIQIWLLSYAFYFRMRLIESFDCQILKHRFAVTRKVFCNL